MSCASCVQRVERALANNEGVAEASVNFASEEARVAYHPETTKPDELIRIIREAGYGVDVRETTFGVTGMTCASCVGRVERALRGLPAVEGAGYGVMREDEGSSVEDSREREYGKLKSDFLLAAALTALVLIGSVPMMLGFMLPVPTGWLTLGLLLLA